MQVEKKRGLKDDPGVFGRNIRVNGSSFIEMRITMRKASFDKGGKEISVLSLARHRFISSWTCHVFSLIHDSDLKVERSVKKYIRVNLMIISSI